MESEKDVWYDLLIAWDEDTITVRRGLRGGEGAEILSAETTLESESTQMGFGLGAKADYLFDDVRFFAPSVEQSTMGRQYAYDAFGRRVAETFFVDGVSQTRYYVYDGDRVVEELDGDGNMTAGYVFGPYVDEVLAMRREVDPESPGLETFYYLHDDQFNVIALTDAAGEVVERYEYGDFGDPTIYDAAGVVREDKTSAFGNVYMFQGRPYDAETGLYYFRTRYLDPVQGRFISRDSIGVWGDANNLGNPYTFVGNSPWTHTDPNGEAIETGWDAFNVGLGLVSLGSNLAEGNWGWAALDAVGVVADGLATAVPFIPGGAGAAIKATRVISAVDTGINVAVSTAGAVEAASSGDLQATALNVAGAVLGAKSMGGGAGHAGGRSAGQLADAGDDAVGNMRWISGGGCLCFTEETLVHAEDGPKTIGEIEIGDYVWSLNEESGETELAVVTGKYKRVTPLLWQIEIAGRVVQTTEEHPFYVEGKGWTEAQRLEVGDPVRTLDGGTEAITAIQVVAQPSTVYNFSVNGNHNYYVSEDGLLVHNMACGLGRTGKQARPKFQVIFTINLFYFKCLSVICVSRYWTRPLQTWSPVRLKTWRWKGVSSVSCSK